MPSRYDSSAGSSLYSQALTSRASSATAVITPLEDFRTSRYVHSDNLVPVGIPGRHHTKALSNTSSMSSDGYVYKSAQMTRRGEHARSDPEPPLGPYFSLPLDSSRQKPAMHRRGTTKDLIGKYESMSSPVKSARPSIASSKNCNLATPEQCEKGDKKIKGRSPIRQSFRNLLSVFTKKGRATGKDMRDEGMDISALLPSRTPKLEPLSIPCDTQAFLSSAEVACNTPLALYCGKLLHLSSPSSPEALPVWTTCNVALHAEHMLVTWETFRGNPSTSIITLAQCTDVRSLTLSDLDVVEYDLLPTGPVTTEPKIFELLFEGKARQKFAALSVKERAGWVGAIWDAVLRTNEQKTYTPSINAIEDNFSKIESPKSHLEQSVNEDVPLSRSNITTKSALSSMFVNRDLPPLPSQATTPRPTPSPSQPRTPIRVELYDPPVPQPSPPLPSPATSRSTYSRLPSPISRSQSPSIRNLDQMSMVKQRLAQLEQSTSRSGSPNSLAEKSTRSRQIVRTLPDSPSAAPGMRSILLRHGTITTIGAESTASMDLDAYDAYEEPEGERSSQARRLTSIPSGESIGTESNPWQKGSNLTTPKSCGGPSILSPASRYSNDSTATGQASSFAALSYAENVEKPLSTRQTQEDRASERRTMSAIANEDIGSAARSTRSLSIFSSGSRYSQDAVAKEQASAALTQLRDVERSVSIRQLALSPPAISIHTASPPDISPPEQAIPVSHAESQHWAQCDGRSSPTSLFYLNPTPASVHVSASPAPPTPAPAPSPMPTSFFYLNATPASVPVSAPPAPAPAPAPVPVPSPSPIHPKAFARASPPAPAPAPAQSVPSADTAPALPRFVTPIPAETNGDEAYAGDAFSQAAVRTVGRTLPEPTISVFSPHWRDNDDASMAESVPGATLFSRFANLGRTLPSLSFAMDPAPPVQYCQAIPPSTGVVTDPEGQKQMAEVQEKLDSVRAELQKLPANISAAVAECSLPSALPPAPAVLDAETKYVLADIDDAVKRIEGQGERNAQGLNGIHAKVDALMSMKKSEGASPPGMSPAGLPPISGLPSGSSSAAMDAGLIMSKLEEMRNELKNDLPMLARKLEDMLAQQGSSEGVVHADSSNGGAPAEKRDTPSEEQVSNNDAIHAKLEEVLSAIQAKPFVPGEGENPPPASDEPNPMLQQILELLNTNKDQHAQVIEQQEDSARYLNELNSWLETFVNHGTSQIDSVVTGVQQLCTELGPTQAVGQDGQPVQHGSLLSDVRQLLVESKGREEGVVALHGSINGLMVAVQEDLRQGAELRHGFNHEAIIGMIERQRQDQENMLRALAHELSNDIRGERLRFVEAMKEATTINVQIHVEEFKKELTREVLLMTQDVARLHRERQGLEQQIADLFAFYAKQKQTASGEQKKKAKQPQQRPQDVYLGVPGVMGPPAVGGRGRPLPNPQAPPVAW